MFKLESNFASLSLNFLLWNHQWPLCCQHSLLFNKRLIHALKRTILEATIKFSDTPNLLYVCLLHFINPKSFLDNGTTEIHCMLTKFIHHSLIIHDLSTFLRTNTFQIHIILGFATLTNVQIWILHSPQPSFLLINQDKFQVRSITSIGLSSKNLKFNANKTINWIKNQQSQYTSRRKNQKILVNRFKEANIFH